MWLSFPVYRPLIDVVAVVVVVVALVLRPNRPLGHYSNQGQKWRQRNVLPGVESSTSINSHLNQKLQNLL